MRLLKTILFMGIAVSVNAEIAVGQYNPLGNVYDIPGNHHCAILNNYGSSDDHMEALMSLATHCNYVNIPKKQVRYSYVGDVQVCAYNNNGNGSCPFSDIMDASTYLDRTCGDRTGGYIHFEESDMIYGRGRFGTNICNLAATHSSRRLLLEN
ncbi:hypothetical protein F4805DRAFT_461096 [Annulohypoxylon moriforme]|nr:hypothetical protein F4805DRAFT_461096 [Annulohypoxylon moriforme]